jgi:hypothetical protein
MAEAVLPVLPYVTLALTPATDLLGELAVFTRQELFMGSGTGHCKLGLGWVAFVSGQRDRPIAPRPRREWRAALLATTGVRHRHLAIFAAKLALEVLVARTVGAFAYAWVGLARVADPGEWVIAVGTAAVVDRAPVFGATRHERELAVVAP